MKKFFKGLLKFLLVTVLIFVAIIIVSYGVKTYKQNQVAKQMENIAITDKSLSTTDILKEAPEEDFDQDGLSNKVEEELGTDPLEHDTDNDGVQDGEEVNTYKTNPKEFSTSGDGVSDAIKIIEKHDPTKKIPSEVEDFTLETEDDGVQVKSNDLNTKYNYIVSSYPLKAVKEFQVREPIFIQDVKGDVLIDYPDDYKGDKASITAYFYDPTTTKFTKVPMQSNNVSQNYLTVTLDTTTKEPDEGFLTSIRMLLANSKVDASSKVVVLSNTNLEDQSTQKEFYLFKWRLSFISENIYFGLLIELSNTSNEESMQWFANKNMLGLHVTGATLKNKVMCEVFAKTALETDHKVFIANDLPGIFRYEHFYSTPKDVQSKYIITKADSFFGLWDLVLEEAENIEVANSLPTPNIIDSGFDPKKNGLSMQNMSPIDVSDGGVCAGMALLSQLKWNGDGSIPVKKDYSVTGLSKIAFKDHPDFSYDLSKNKESYKNLLGGKDLYSYKATDGLITGDSLFKDGDAKPYYTEDISEPDRGMLEMIELYYAVGNSNLFEHYSYKTNDARILTSLEDYIRAGNVAYVGIAGEEGGHAILGYKLEKIEDNPNELILYVYDVNFPGGYVTVRDKETSEVISANDYTDSFKIYLHKYKKKELEGFSLVEKEYFSFDYAPLPDLCPTYAWKISDDSAKRITFVKSNRRFIKEKNTLGDLVAE